MKALTLLTPTLILLLSVEILRADSATWNLNPGSGDWSTAVNWTPASVPNGSGDTATFDESTVINVGISAATEVNGIMFNQGASAFTITAPQGLTISGAGITNNSGTAQNFQLSDAIKFVGTARAGLLTVFSSVGSQFFSSSSADRGTFVNQYSRKGTVFFDYSTAGSGTFTNFGTSKYFYPYGVTSFRDHSSAGNGTFTNHPGIFGGFHGSGPSGRTTFSDSATAGDGSFTNNGYNETKGSALGGFTYFNGASSAGNGSFTNEGGVHPGGGGQTLFDNTSTAGNGIFTNNGGAVDGAGGGTFFIGNSSGGTARVILFGDSELSIRDHKAPGMAIGSVEGSGAVILGQNRLKVGSNNLSTTLSGVVQDGAVYERGGSLEKIGNGTLTLSGANTYTGGTLISSGTLDVTRDGGLGRGDVVVTTSGATLRLQTGATDNYIADTAVFNIVSGSTVDLNFDGTPDTVLALVVDGVVQPAGLYGSAASGAPHQLPEFTGSGQIQASTAMTPTPTPTPTPSSHATNLSTRLLVGTGNDVGIGGFIINGSGPRHLLLRGIGPSLGEIIPNTMADPLLELHGAEGFQTLANNNWRESQEAEIIATGRAPSNDLESAIVADLAPGVYTAVLAGNGGTTGVGLVEIYDLSTTQDSTLTNISTRGKVGTSDDIVIAGFILGQGTGEDAIIVRGLGPSLSETGVSALPDPKLELRDSQGALIASDDNWMDDPNQAQIILAAGLAPSNNLESAIAATLAPGEYTALLSGMNDGTGVGLVEVYDQGAPAN